MNDRILILSQNHHSTDQLIWREAIRRGWKTYRINNVIEDLSVLDGADMVRYYGDTLTAERYGDKLPIEFSHVPPTFLSSIQPWITGRCIRLVTWRDLIQPLEKTCFIKCVGNKWFPAKVYNEGETIISSSLPTDMIYVQSVIHFTHEIRCFVLGKKILTASWYRRDDDICLIRETLKLVLDPIQTMLYHLELPSDGIVLDFGVELHLIEANEAWASGLYDCHPTQAFDVIVASQSNKA